MLARTVSGSGASPWAKVDCFRPEPLALLDMPRRDEDESLDTKDIDEPRLTRPGRCEVRYGARTLEVRRGSGDWALLWLVLLDGDGVAPGGGPPNRSSHMLGRLMMDAFGVVFSGSVASAGGMRGYVFRWVGGT